MIVVLREFWEIGNIDLISLLLRGGRVEGEEYEEELKKHGEKR